MCVLTGVVLWVIPIEIFCLQGFFPSLFNKMGNGGTWFISCLFFSYLLFPVLNKIVSITKKDYLIVFLLYLSIIYTVMLGVDLKIKWVAIYIHPVYRMLEFVVGMYIGKIFINKQLVWRF
jgi:peptidoglycan/LPS O-acetylase OafA/YrhL